MTDMTAITVGKPYPLLPAGVDPTQPSVGWHIDGTTWTVLAVLPNPADRAEMSGQLRFGFLADDTVVWLMLRTKSMIWDLAQANLAPDSVLDIDALEPTETDVARKLIHLHVVDGDGIVDSLRAVTLSPQLSTAAIQHLRRLGTAPPLGRREYVAAVQRRYTQWTRPDDSWRATRIRCQAGA